MSGEPPPAILEKSQKDAQKEPLSPVASRKPPAPAPPPSSNVPLSTQSTNTQAVPQAKPPATGNTTTSVKNTITTTAPPGTSTAQPTAPPNKNGNPPPAAPVKTGNNVTPIAPAVSGNTSINPPATTTKNGSSESSARRVNDTPGRREDNILEESPQGRFHRFDEVLGKGGFKIVYKAYDSLEGCEVAWNVVKLNGIPEDEKKRIVNEVNLLYTLKHENILEFRGTWVKSRDEIIFITEILGAGSLKQFIKKVKVIRWKVVKRWISDILNGLSYLHTRDPPVIHRDLKCDNIFINGQRGDLRIGDLGLSRRKDMAEKSKMALTMAGTPAFMAPEFYTEQYDEKVDIYALGMCTLEMLTKEYPYYECSNTAQIMKLVMDGILPQSLEGITLPSAKDFITKCLAADPASRPCAEELKKHEFLKKGLEDDIEVKLGVPLELKRRSSVQISDPGKVSPGPTASAPAAAAAKVQQSNPPATNQSKPSVNQGQASQQANPSVASQPKSVQPVNQGQTSQSAANPNQPANKNASMIQQNNTNTVNVPLKSPMKNNQPTNKSQPPVQTGQGNQVQTGHGQPMVTSTTNQHMSAQPPLQGAQLPNPNHYTQPPQPQQQPYIQQPHQIHAPSQNQLQPQHMMPPQYNTQQPHLTQSQLMQHNQQDVPRSRSYEDEQQKARTSSSDSFDPSTLGVPLQMHNGNTTAQVNVMLMKGPTTNNDHIQQQHMNNNHYGGNQAHQLRSHLAQQVELTPSTSSGGSFEALPQNGEEHYFTSSNLHHDHQQFYATPVDDQHQSDALQHQSSGIMYDYDTNPESTNEVNVDIELPITGDLTIVSFPYDYLHDEPLVVATEMCEAFGVPEQVESIVNILTDIRHNMNKESGAEDDQNNSCCEKDSSECECEPDRLEDDPKEKEALDAAINAGTKYDEGRLKRMEENLLHQEKMEEARRNKYLQELNETKKKIELQRKIIEDKRNKAVSDYHAAKLLKPQEISSTSSTTNVSNNQDSSSNDNKNIETVGVVDNNNNISSSSSSTTLDSGQVNMNNNNIINSVTQTNSVESLDTLGNSSNPGGRQIAVEISTTPYQSQIDKQSVQNNGNASPSKSNFPFIDSNSDNIAPPPSVPISRGNSSNTSIASSTSSTNLSSIGSNSSTSSTVTNTPQVVHALSGPQSVDPTSQQQNMAGVNNFGGGSGRGSGSGPTNEILSYPALSDDLFTQPN